MMACFLIEMGVNKEGKKKDPVSSDLYRQLVSVVRNEDGVSRQRVTLRNSRSHITSVLIERQIRQQRQDRLGRIGERLHLPFEYHWVTLKKLVEKKFEDGDFFADHGVYLATYPYLVATKEFKSVESILEHLVATNRFESVEAIHQFLANRTSTVLPETPGQTKVQSDLS